MSEVGKTGTEGEGGDAAAAAASAPTIALADLKTAGLPDTYFGEDGSLKAQDLTAHLTEYGTLKQQATERAALIPADGAYSFDLPKDFASPAGQDWKPDATFTAEISALAKEQGLTQADVSKLTAAYATHLTRKAQADADAAKADDDAEIADATKVLGANYLDVIANIRQASQARLTDLIGKEKGELLAKEIHFETAAGIKAYSDLINALGTHQAQQAASGTENKNADLAAKVGTPGFTAMDIFNAASK